MASRRASSGSSRNTLSLAIIALGVVLLLLVPIYLVLLALSGSKDVELPGTLVILSVVSGMALVVIGAAIRE